MSSLRKRIKPQKDHERKQINAATLNRCPCYCPSVLTFQLANRLTLFGSEILDGVCFVQYNSPPLHYLCRHPHRFIRQSSVSSQHQIMLLKLLSILCPFFPVIQVSLQCTSHSVILQLRYPCRHNRRRTHHQRCFCFHSGSKGVLTFIPSSIL